MTGPRWPSSPSRPPDHAGPGGVGSSAAGRTTATAAPPERSPPLLGGGPVVPAGAPLQLAQELGVVVGGHGPGRALRSGLALRTCPPAGTSWAPALGCSG